MTVTARKYLKPITEGRYLMEIVLILLALGLAIAAPRFFTTRNLLNVLRNASMQGVIAFGMTMIIISGEIDLSVGSAVAFAGSLTAFLIQLLVGFGTSVGAAVLIAATVALGCGFCIGSTTAFLRNRFMIPSFITTLAFMTILSGAANLITGGFPITSFPPWFNFLGGGRLLGIPVPALIFVAVFVVIHFLMTSTGFGRSVYAVGGNAEAARLNGINVARVKWVVFAITGVLAALSGLMVAAQIMSGTPTVARGWELQVISAVIIGGTSLFGGSGRIWGTFIGVLFLAVIVNGMTLLGISPYWQHVVRGLLILIAVLVNNLGLIKR